MMSRNLLISFASWEDRFRLGFNLDVENTMFAKSLVFCFEDYKRRTIANRRSVRNLCREKSISYREETLDGDNPSYNWSVVVSAVQKGIVDCESVLINISTMPREIIWHVFRVLDESCIFEVRYVYYGPEKYSTRWLSRDPRTPRLVYKLSGLASPGIKTALIVTAGFDPQRAIRLRDWCEPSKMMIGIQTGSRFNENQPRMDAFRKMFAKMSDCTIFELNSYADDHGVAEIQCALRDIGDSHNVIMGSLGPKLTAVALYRIQKSNPQYALVYAPSRQFSKEYSSGIGKSFVGIL